MTEAELQHFVEEWTRTLRNGDGAGAAALRGDGYRFTAPDGEEMSAGEELDPARFHGFEPAMMVARRASAEPTEGGAAVRFDADFAGVQRGARVRGRFRYVIDCRRAGGDWVARSARAELVEIERLSPRVPLAARVRRRAGRLARALGLRRKGGSPGAGFGRLAYLPHRPGEDFLVPLSAGSHSPASPDALPKPPASLWTDSHYGKHDASQAALMLQVAEASGLSFNEGDRILDLGCGSGRLIRELAPLAGRCEIWGLDISAPHILWCRQNLSPPFHFATCTKVPHLPFADASFRFVFCSSLFTHIDDLAEAWLLEIRRILAPDGRLFATFHDERTVALLEGGDYEESGMARALRASPTYQAAVRDGFATFAMGRDSDSQVFHHSRWIAQMAAPAFDVVAVREQAYHYQTGYLMAPRARRGA